MSDVSGNGKGKAKPLVRTAKQKKAAEAAALGAAQAAETERAQTEAQASAARLAQIVNLTIAGFSLAQIGASIGATADEVDRMLNQDTQRYVRNQPALRTYVRNYVSGKYTELLDAVWEEATDRDHPEKLENSAQALRIVERMARLHGAEAPTQTEVQVDAAPDTVEKMVAALSARSGYGYDTDVFDTVAGEVTAEQVHDAVSQRGVELEASGAAVEQPDETDTPLEMGRD